MKEFIVTLYVRSQSYSPAEISGLVGLEPTDCHKRGDLTIRGNSCYLDHFWWLESGMKDDATIEVHGKALMASLNRLSPEFFDLSSAGDLDVSIGVGIMYDTYTTSVRLPREFIAFASRIGANIKVSSYPTDFQADEGKG